MSNLSLRTDAETFFADHGPFRAVIFDFDGVLADSETVHYRTFAETLAEVGIPVSEEEHASVFLGLDDLGGFRLAFELAGRGKLGIDDGRALLDRKSARYAALLREIPLFDGVREAIAEASRRGPFTIASCGRRCDIEAVLGHHGLLAETPPFISADDITRSKPDPECYEKALGLLRSRHDSTLSAADCLVFEDSFRGVEAAKRAGMTCVALTHSYTADRLGHADWIIDSWNEWRWPATTR
jgi:beta-phosphoglucomutase